MNNNFFSLLINPAKKNTVSDSFIKIVDKDGIQKKYDNLYEKDKPQESFKEKIKKLFK